MVAASVEVAVVGGPPERGAQVGQFGGEPVVSLPLPGAVPQGHDVGFAPGEVAGMGGADLVGRHRWRRVAPRRTGGSSPASRTGSAPMTGRRPAATCAPARRADPGRRSRRHRIRQPRSAGEVEAAGEHRTPLQHSLLGVVEQVIGPLHRVAQRLVAFQAAPRPDQQPEAVIEAIAHFARRSSTPSERPPTRSPAESRRGGGRSRPPRSASSVHREARSDSAGRVRRTASPRPSRFPRDVQRRHRPDLLVGHPKSFAAGGEDLHRRRLREDGVDRGRRRRRAHARSCRTPAAVTRPSNAAATLTRHASCRAVG